MKKISRLIKSSLCLVLVVALVSGTVPALGQDISTWRFVRALRADMQYSPVFGGSDISDSDTYFEINDFDVETDEYPSVVIDAGASYSIFPAPELDDTGGSSDISDEMECTLYPYECYDYEYTMDEPLDNNDELKDDDCIDDCPFVTDEMDNVPCENNYNDLDCVSDNDCAVDEDTPYNDIELEYGSTSSNDEDKACDEYYESDSNDLCDDDNLDDIEDELPGDIDNEVNPDTGSQFPGAGTIYEPFVLYTLYDLMYVRNAIYDGVLIQNVPAHTAAYVLGNNIYASDDFSFFGIGTADFPFMGQFDGAGFYIMLDIFAPWQDYIGLFGHTSGAVIQNLVLMGSVEGASNVGAVVGHAQNSTRIVNVTSYAEVTAHAHFAGGIAGRLENSSIQNANVRGNVYGGGACRRDSWACAWP